MLISLPHNVSVNIRPRGVSFPNDEAVSGDNSQTDAEAGLKRRAEVVQPEFEVFLLLQGDVWVGRFRENFLHNFLKMLWWAYLRYCVIGVSAYMSGITVFLIGSGWCPYSALPVLVGIALRLLSPPLNGPHCRVRHSVRSSTLLTSRLGGNRT